MTENLQISISSKIRELGFHSLVYGVGSIAQSALGLILLPVLTGSLSLDDYGAYSLITMLCVISSAIFYLGITSALPRSYFDYPEDNDRRCIFTTAFLIIAIGGLLQSLVGYYFSGDLSILLVGTDAYKHALSWALCGAAVSFINTFFFTYLRLQRQSTAYVLFSLLSLISSVVLTLFLIQVESERILAPFKGILFSQLLIAVTFLMIFGRHAFTLKYRALEVGNLLNFGLGAVLASFAQILIDWSDRLIIEENMNLADVGIYSAAFRVGMLINVVLIVPFMQIWSPMMMEYRTKPNVKSLFSYAFSIFIILGGILLLTAIMFGQDLLPILIKMEVNNIVILVAILTMAGFFISGLTNILVAGIFYERKVYRLSALYYGLAGLKIGFNLFLIPAYGLLGASFSTIFICTLTPILVYALAKNFFAFPIEWWRLRYFLLVVLPSLGYMVLIFLNVEILLYYRVLYFFTSLFFIYYLCLLPSEKVSVRSFIGGICDSKKSN